MNKSFLILLISLLLATCKPKQHQTNYFKITPTELGYKLIIFDKNTSYTYEFARKPQNKDQIKIPVYSVAVTSTTHIGYLNALNSLKIIVAASGKNFIIAPYLRQKLDSITELGFMPEINLEQLINSKPQVLLTNQMTFSEQEMKMLKNFGITVIPIYEYLANSPIDRLEWIKIFGVLTDKYEQACRYYDSVSNNYLALKDIAQKIAKNKKYPTVLVNIPYQGIWYVPGGNSYIAKFISHARGDYYWADKKTETSIPLNIEQVMQKAINADILLNPGTATSIEQILTIDKRLRLFNAVKKQNVYNYYKNALNNGATAFWENGATEPDKILSDLINIFYPENKVIKDTLYYYIKLKSK